MATKSQSAHKSDGPPEEPAADYIVAISFDRVDPYSLVETRFEVEQPYPCDGPDLELYLERGLIVPADAGSASESASTEDQEN